MLLKNKDTELEDLHLLSEDAVLNPESIADIVLQTKLDKNKKQDAKSINAHNIDA